MMMTLFSPPVTSSSRCWCDVSQRCPFRARGVWCRRSRCPGPELQLSQSGQQVGQDSANAGCQRDKWRVLLCRKKVLRKELEEEPSELKISSYWGEVSQQKGAWQVSASGGAGCSGAEESGFVAVPDVSEIGEPCLGFEEQAGCGLLRCDVGTQR